MHSTKKFRQLSSNDPQSNLVFYATIINNLDLLKKGIELGDDINFRDEYGITPLHMAVFANFDLVECLIENGADINAINMHGYTPLFYSLYHNDTKLCTYLIEHGAKIDIKNKFGETPLLIATYLNNISGVRLLARLGANVNTLDNKGISPIILASNMKNFNMIRCLAKLGANINVLNRRGYSPLRVALNGKNLKLTRHLIKMGAIIHNKDISGLSSKFLKVLSTSKNPLNLNIIIIIALKLKNVTLLTNCLDKYYLDISKNSIHRLPLHLDNSHVDKELSSFNQSLSNIYDAKEFLHKLYTSYTFISLKNILCDPDSKASEKATIEALLSPIKKFRHNVYSLLNTTVIESLIIPAKRMQKKVSTSI